MKFDFFVTDLLAVQVLWDNVTWPDIVTTTMTISTSLVFYLYMDIWKIK